MTIRPSVINALEQAEMLFHVAFESGTETPSTLIGLSMREGGTDFFVEADVCSEHESAFVEHVQQQCHRFNTRVCLFISEAWAEFADEKIAEQFATARRDEKNRVESLVVTIEEVGFPTVTFAAVISRLVLIPGVAIANLADWVQLSDRHRRFTDGFLFDPQTAPTMSRGEA